jgi:hypothetical protein
MVQCLGEDEEMGQWSGAGDISSRTVGRAERVGSGEVPTVGKRSYRNGRRKRSGRLRSPGAHPRELAVEAVWVGGLLKPDAVQPIALLGLGSSLA